MKNQEQRVLDYLREKGSITAVQAFTDLHITQLGTRIFNLRARGYDIDRVDEKYKNAYGQTITYGKYVLNEG